MLAIGRRCILILSLKIFEAAVKKAVSVGATLEVSITAHKWGRMALMADPFGNGYCFVEFLGRGYDEIAQ